jgi:hypothetical protein
MRMPLMPLKPRQTRWVGSIPAKSAATKMQRVSAQMQRGPKQGAIGSFASTGGMR